MTAKKLGIEFKTEKRLLSELIPASYNPRTLSKKQKKDLENSLSKFGLAEIPVINTENLILAGHQRVRVLYELKGDQEIDVRVPVRELTESECKEYNLRSNKNTGSWDFDILGNEFTLEELEFVGFEDSDLRIDGGSEEMMGNPKKYNVTIECTDKITMEETFEVVSQLGLNVNIKKS